ncbi:MAG TPA: LacI family transcriptional regulator [Treponema sp.]|nr:LacI family transcriptional regulator [Treponema sp.]
MTNLEKAVYNTDMSNRLRNTGRITMDDIASKLGLSKTTVSRAISGKGRICQDTRDRILACIRENGYQPNQMARALAASRTYNIAIVIPDEKSGGEAQFFSDCLVGITKAAVSHDYDTVLVVVPDDDMSGLERLVRNSKADGVVVTRMNEQDRIIPFLKSRKLPFVLIGTNTNGDILQIDSNQQEGCRELTKHMLDAGCRRIALLAGNRGHIVDMMRYEGYKAAFEESGLHPDEHLVFWNAQQNCAAAVNAALEAHADCIVCMDDMICIGAVDYLTVVPVRIPDELQVVSFYDSAALSSGKIPVTALHVDSLNLCMRAGNLLIDEIEGRTPPRRNVAEYSIIYRNSSR